MLQKCRRHSSTFSTRPLKKIYRETSLSNQLCDEIFDPSFEKPLFYRTVSVRYGYENSYDDVDTNWLLYFKLKRPGIITDQTRKYWQVLMSNRRIYYQKNNHIIYYRRYLLKRTIPKLLIFNRHVQKQKQMYVASMKVLDYSIYPKLQLIIWTYLTRLECKHL